jgi:uncharacterized membrane protein YuzA (DUF378 family)
MAAWRFRSQAFQKLANCGAKQDRQTGQRRASTMVRKLLFLSLTLTGVRRKERDMARPTSTLGAISLVLLIIGGLNWGLVGLADFDVVAAIFGEGSLLSRIVYVLVGLAAIVSAMLFSRLVHMEPSRT